MDAKLTLRLNEEIILKAKQYAKDRNISLSKLIEGMLSRVTNSDDFKPEITPLVESLSGIIDADNIDREDYRNYLEEKYK